MTHAAEKTQPSCCFMKRLVTPRNFGDVTVGGLPPGCLPKNAGGDPESANTGGVFRGGFFDRKIGSDLITPYISVVGYPWDERCIY